MAGSATPLSVLGPQAESERQRIRQQFETGTSAPETLRAICDLADRHVRQVFAEALRVHGGGVEGLCLVALGGYGRQLLYPYSDLDLMFLLGTEKAEQEFRPLIAEFSRTLWDLGFRVSSAGRTIDECKRVEEDNVEFHLALLDRRFLAGDTELYERLDAKVLAASEKQGRGFLQSELQKLTRERLARYGNTIFHLEPNVKESPGGLRDFQAANWLRLLSPERNPILTAGEQELAGGAVDFLSAIRCFLHYRNERNDNTLTYELQSAAAERALGVRDAYPRSAAEWMRLYFRHARTLNRQLLRILEHKSPSAQSLTQRLLSAARAPRGEQSTTSAGPFVLREGLLEVADQRALADRNLTYAMLTEAARSNVPISREAERCVSYILTHPELPQRNTQLTWSKLQEILRADYPGLALRPMQRLGLLAEALPEFGRIDSLVVRDFYHRYTVDEHTLRTIEHLQELAEPPDGRGKAFSSMWKTVEQRHLLTFALLLHDIGKGMPVDNHVTGSLEALESAAARLGLTPEEKSEVRFLIEHHLDMSATMQRRDIFDPATVSGFAAIVKTQERLQRLCLLTYADIHAVNPEALTPWKAEMLWQLFVATSNHFSRTLDRDRLHAADEAAVLAQVRHLAGLEGEIEKFLEGFPRRYLAMHSGAEIARHFAMYRRLKNEPVQTEVLSSQHAFSLTLLTADRPALFATIAGVLAGWGMNIVKADAFSNASGVILDTFHFADLHRTLELNPQEVERFEKNLKDVLNGKAGLESLLKTRISATKARVPKVTVPTRINFDSASSAQSTLIEIATQDHPGLLHEIGSVLAKLKCNIEVALIDTEGHRAIDVFYLTEQGAKLSAAKERQVREALLDALRG